MCHFYEQDRISDELAEKAFWAEYERQYEIDCQNDYELNGCGFDRIAMGM